MLGLDQRDRPGQRSLAALSSSIRRRSAQRLGGDVQPEGLQVAFAGLDVLDDVALALARRQHVQRELRVVIATRALQKAVDICLRNPAHKAKAARAWEFALDVARARVSL